MTQSRVLSQLWRKPVKINYQRGENLKKKKKVGKLSTFMLLDRHSFRYLKQIENRKFRKQFNNAIRRHRYDFLPVPKKTIWWDC